MSLILSTLLGIFLFFAAVFVLLLKRRYTYWSSRGVTQLEPKLLIGNLDFKQNNDITFSEQYKNFKAKGLKFGGVYTFWKPTLIVLDTDLLKHILVKDFDHFMNRTGSRINDKDPFAGMLPAQVDEKWRSLRSKLTPTFTSGKMKMMFGTFVESSRVFKDVLNSYSETKAAVQIKYALNKFTMEIIGSCAFGVECDTMKNPDSAFQTLIQPSARASVLRRYMTLIMPLLPSSLISVLNVHMMPQNMESFFVNLVKEMVEYRETHNVYRKDFMHLMIQLKNRGQVTDDEKIRDEKGLTHSFLTMKEIYAQCFVFFMAGFETSSTAMTFALYELAVNPDVQQNLRQEITDVLRKHDNKLTYEAILDMSYLDRVLKETLRLHPPVGVVSRRCTKDYNLPNTNIVIEKDIFVSIPVLGIHMDEQYYPNPEKFDPERFTPENSAKRPGCTWLPFGEGPRNCIGLRFALLQSKVGLVTILSDFKVTLNNQTRTPLVLDNGSVVRKVVGDIWLNIHRLKEH